MILLNFVGKYADEESCCRKFKEYREQQGVVFPHCGHKGHYWKKTKRTINSNIWVNDKVYEQIR